MTEEDRKQLDREASYFAMHLLVPTKFLRASIEKLGGEIDFTRDEVVVGLAKEYRVPVGVMVKRIQEFMEKGR